jgi:uncharacterized protein (TIGR00297 family)
MSDSTLASEYRRKAVHIGSSFFAVLLRWLNFWQAALCALIALIFNSLILPRIGGRNLYRENDVVRGYPLGIVLYPISVLLVILLFPHRLYIAAAAWGIMAWGDGMASIFGKKYGVKKLPWNENRSYAGSLAFLIFGGIAAVFFTWWTWKQPFGVWPVVMIPILATILATIIETIPTGLDDNLTVPLSAGFFLFALYHIEPSMLTLRQTELLHNFLIGAAVNLVIAGIALVIHTVSFSGFASGFLIGTILYTFGGWPIFATLMLFFFLGTAATKFGYARKKSLGVAQEKGGARGWKNATANCSLGAFLALLSALCPSELQPMFIAGVFAAFATAAADTVSSEIGQVLGKHPILITTLRPVPVGTEGAISLEGTFAGIVAGAIICALGVALHLLTIPVAAICWLASFIGTTVESYLGATLETMKIIDNEVINFMNTLVGAAVAMLLVALL